MYQTRRKNTLVYKGLINSTLHECSRKILNIISGNGYIEDKELDGFLVELVTSVNAADVGPEVREIIVALVEPTLIS